MFDNADLLRQNMHELYVRPQSFLPPTRIGDDIDIDRIDVNAWPLYRVSSKKKQASPRSALVYTHGGAFYREIESYHWNLIMETVRETHLDVIVPIYPLLPRPTSGAAEVIPTLVEICRTVKQPVVGLMGDSAGGTIALATTQHMRNVAPELFARLAVLVLISPVLDLSLTNPEVFTLAKNDPWLGVEGLRVCGALWAGNLPVTEPLVSPLFGDIEHLPPTMLLAGTSDMLCADARRLSGKFQGKGDDTCVAGCCDLERFKFVEAEGMIHVYPILPTSEGAEARHDIIAFVSKHIKVHENGQSRL